MVPEVLTIQKGRGKTKYAGKKTLFVPGVKGPFALWINTSVKNDKKNIIAYGYSLTSFRCVSIYGIYQINPFGKG